MSRPGDVDYPLLPTCRHPESTSRPICTVRAGPSQEAREAGIRKRQKQAGTVLFGRAAVLRRRADLVERGTPNDLLDEMTASVGLPGQPFYTTTAGSASTTSKHHLAALPEDFSMQVARDEQRSCAAVFAYHAHVCDGKPDEPAGRDAALARGWAGPQQAFALTGKHPSSGRKCNVAIVVHQACQPVGLLAMSLSKDARGCIVQAIHAAPKVRGPLCVPEHMWRRATTCISEMARAQRSAAVRFSLEMPCCQSQQGAHFWIVRNGWDGTEHAKQAAKEWGLGVKWKPGTYESWYQLTL